MSLFYSILLTLSLKGRKYNLLSKEKATYIIPKNRTVSLPKTKVVLKVFIVLFFVLRMTFGVLGILFWLSAL